MCKCSKPEIQREMGTTNPVKKVARWRHWFTLVSNGPEGPRFVDNATYRPGKPRKIFTLRGMKRRMGKHPRVICNVHDPYARYRDRLTVQGGQLALAPVPTRRTERPS